MVSDEIRKQIEAIDDYEKLEKWLENKPVELSQSIATRTALRVLPLLNGEFVENGPKPEHLALQLFRTALLLILSDRWNTRDAVLASALASFCGASVHSYSAFCASAQLADVAAASIRTGDTRRAARLVYSAFAAAAAYSGQSARYSTILNSVRLDLIAWERSGTNDERQRAHLKAPLWLEDIPDWFKSDWNDLVLRLLESDNNWQVWIGWYEDEARLGLPNKHSSISNLDHQSQIELAMKPQDFWDRESAEVNAEIIRWLEEAGGKVDEKARENSELTEEHKKTAAALAYAGILQIEEYREKIRGTNDLSEELRIELLGLLDSLKDDLEKLISLLSDLKSEPSEAAIDEIKSWLGRFNQKLKGNLRKYAEPEFAADVAPPIGIILTCGAIGASFGGPIGFGAGALVGKLIIGEAKPGTVADKVGEIFKEDQPDQ